ncbi:hypothetical protein IGJ83_000708 [Enterococcus pernyi]
MNGYRKYRKIFLILSILGFILYLYFGKDMATYTEGGMLFILAISLGSLFLGTRSNNFYDKWEKFNEKAQKDLDELNKHTPAQKENKNIIKCPTCQSREVQFMQNNKKGFSVGKAIGGAALTGGIGTLAGFAGKKGKNQWFCTNCHTTFETK